MSGWVEVARLAHLPPGAALAVVAGGFEVALFNDRGELFACQARCPHRNGPLAEGMVRDGVVTCPFHWWRFDLGEGRRLGGTGERIARYPLRVRSGRVEVLISSPPPETPLRERLLAAGRDWTAARGGEGLGPPRELAREDPATLASPAFHPSLARVECVKSDVGSSQ